MKSGRLSISIKIILAIIIIMAALIPTSLVSSALINSAIKRNIDTSTSEMQGQILILSNQLQAADYVSNATTSNMNPFIEQVADIWGGRIQIIDTSCRIIKDTYRVDNGNYNISEYTLLALNGSTSNYLDQTDMVVALSQPLYSATEMVPANLDDEIITTDKPEYVPKITGAILVTADMSKHVAGMVQIRNQMYLLWLVSLCIAIIGAILVAVYMFRPFDRLAVQIENAYDGNIDTVDVNTYKETNKISQAVNHTIARMKALDKSRSEFVSNVSHEIKTPIASMRVLADSINSMGEAPVEMYREFMNDISHELERETNIVDDLLSMVRLENGVAKLNISKVNINEWLEDALRRMNPLADEAGVSLSFESMRPVEADIDETKFNLVITNLVNNAIKYNKENGYIKIKLDADYHFMLITIEDNGEGMDEESVTHIFERFYRIDKARSRESGGTGLGLPLAKQIVMLHHGQIRVASKLGEGSTFTVKVPLEYREKEEISDEEVSE